ncbi:MAG: glycosyltransferase, partial [Methylocystaceae bacterium]|nr:glycosyltransferase [Methylocystaceae bacterium]
ANIAIEAGLACLGSGLRIIGCEHNIPSRSVRGRLWIWLRPFAYRRMSAVTTLTRGAHQELAPLCGATPLKVIPNALRLPLGVTEPQLDPCDFVPDGAPLLLAMGRMVPAKGFDILIQRFADLAAQHPDAHLVILGDGPLRAELTEQVARLGLGARVSLPGRTGNVAQWYTRAALYLMTSRWEGMPMVLLETMGHGTVPVVTDFRHGPRDVIRDGIDGVILPEADEALWQETVLRLLADPERRAEMSARALEVRTRFGEPMVMQAWAELLAQVAPEKV